MKNFQVCVGKGDNASFIKSALITLYEHYVGKKVSGRDTVIYANHYDYLQFSFYKEGWDVTHTIGEFRDKSHPYETITIEEATKRLMGHEKTHEIKLNDDYTATVSKNQVTVGCQTFDISLVRQILKAADSL